MHSSSIWFPNNIWIRNPPSINRWGLFTKHDLQFMHLIQYTVLCSVYNAIKLQINSQCSLLCIIEKIFFSFETIWRDHSHFLIISASLVIKPDNILMIFLQSWSGCIFSVSSFWPHQGHGSSHVYLNSQFCPLQIMRCSIVSLEHISLLPWLYEFISS